MASQPVYCPAGGSHTVHHRVVLQRRSLLQGEGETHSVHPCQCWPLWGIERGAGGDRTERNDTGTGGQGLRTNGAATLWGRPGRCWAQWVVLDASAPAYAQTANAMMQACYTNSRSRLRHSKSLACTCTCSLEPRLLNPCHPPVQCPPPPLKSPPFCRALWGRPVRCRPRSRLNPDREHVDGVRQLLGSKGGCHQQS